MAGILLQGFLMGMQHAMEVDHMAALLPLPPGAAMTFPLR